MKKEKFVYDGSIVADLKRIEVFSFSNHACPFYTLDRKSDIIVIGGTIRGSLSEIEDPIFEARIFSGAFVNDFAYAFETGQSLYPYETAKMMHKVVADTGIMEPQRVRIDIYSNGKNFKYALGGSSYLLDMDEDGNIFPVLDDVELEKMGIINAS